MRRYFPKDTDFRKVSDAQVEQGVLATNQPPLKYLHCQSPEDVFLGGLTRALGS